MPRWLLPLFVFVGSFAPLAAKFPIAVRLVGFDATVRQVAGEDAQVATLELLEGRKAGQTYPVALVPSVKTAGLVGRSLYLRMPPDYLAKRDSVYWAGELLDLEPAYIPPDFFIKTPFKENARERYLAGRVALDGVNEINGVYVPAADPKQWLTARAAIAGATQADPDAIQGTFVFVVKACAEADGHLWLNSETDYRDPQSLNVGLPLRCARDLTLRWSQDAAELLKGRTVVVSGIARRVKYEGLTGGHTYTYTQTQVRLWSAHQLRLLP